MYFKMVGLQIRSQMQFRVSFWMDTFSTALLNGLVFFSIALIFERFGQLQGWALGEVAYLYGMAEMCFALAELIFSGFQDDYFSDLIREGRFDQLLLKPVDMTWQILGSQFQMRRLGRFALGLGILITAVTVGDIQWSWLKVVFFLVTLLSQVLFMGGFFIMGATLTFWTVESIEAVNILTYGGNEVMNYPMTIYSRPLRFIFTYIVPFIFMNFYPALYILDKPDPLNFPAFAPFIAPVIAVLFFSLMLRFWQFGINHYQSTGS
jgi:ABC-2 type transport system permease protein